MTSKQFLSEIDDKAPPAPADTPRRFEAKLGGRLPDDCREFLIQCNGGYVGGSLWLNGPAPDGTEAGAGVHHIGGFRGQDSFSLFGHREAYASSIPRELLWIMDDPFGNAICLGIAGEHRGKVYFWDHENEPHPEDWDGSFEAAGNIQTLANSFTDFVAGLRPTEDL